MELSCCGLVKCVPSWWLIPSFALSAACGKPPDKASEAPADTAPAAEAAAPAGPKAIVTVIYNTPKDTAKFEKYYRETHLPLVSANLSIAGGSALDPATKAGLASLTADMATRGTATRSATDIARQVESLGGSLSSGAGPDASNVSLGVRSDKAKDLFAIFADVVENPAFKDDELARAHR